MELRSLEKEWEKEDDRLRYRRRSKRKIQLKPKITATTEFTLPEECSGVLLQVKSTKVTVSEEIHHMALTPSEFGELQVKDVASTTGECVHKNHLSKLVLTTFSDSK